MINKEGAVPPQEGAAADVAGLQRGLDVIERVAPRLDRLLTISVRRASRTDASRMASSETQST